MQNTKDTQDLETYINIETILDYRLGTVNGECHLGFKSTVHDRAVNIENYPKAHNAIR